MQPDRLDDQSACYVVNDPACPSDAQCAGQTEIRHDGYVVNVGVLLCGVADLLGELGQCV